MEQLAIPGIPLRRKPRRREFKSRKSSRGTYQGWEDCGTYLRRQVVARKDYLCVRCQRTILKGSRADVIVNKDDKGNVDFRHSTFEYFHSDKGCRGSGTE